jgi:hydrogenase-4 component E
MNGATYSSFLEIAAGLVILCAFVTLWRRSLRAIVRTLAVQGMALGVVALVLGVHRRDVVLIVVGCLVVGSKGLLIPTLVRRVLANEPQSRETSPLVNVPSSLVGAGALTFLAYGATRPVVALVSTSAGRLIPLGLATMLIGFFSMVVRRKAVSQIVGLLLVDNGIALVAFLATAGVPLLVELGASLDVLLVIVVLRVLAVQLWSKFAVLDLDQLQELHD